MIEENSALSPPLFGAKVIKEIVTARDEYPMPNLNVYALLEELGEVVEEIINSPLDREKLETELIQVAAMAGRVFCEGDPGIDPKDPVLMILKNLGRYCKKRLEGRPTSGSRSDVYIWAEKLYKEAKD